MRLISTDPARSERLFPVLLLGLLMAHYFAFGGYKNWPYKIEGDGKYFYQYLVSAVYDWDLDFSNQYRIPKYPWMRTEIDNDRFQDAVSPVTGRPANIFWPGSALLWFPFFAVSWSLGTLLNAVGLAVDMNPFGRWFQFGVMVAGPAYAALALVLLGRLLSRPRVVSVDSSRLALVLVLFASPLYYYAIFEPSMSHVYDLLAFVLYLLAVLQWVERGRLRDLAALSLAGGLFILVRPQNAATVALFSLVHFFLPARPGQEGTPVAFLHLRRLAGCALPLLLGVLPILALNRYLYGGAFVVKGAGSVLDPAHPNLLGVLFSARNGLFSHHPLLLVGLAGFVWLLASRPVEVPKWFLWTLLGAFLVQVWVNASTSDWWGGAGPEGHSFGQRRLLSSLPLFVLGLAFLLEKVRRRSGDRFTGPVLAMAAVTVALGFYLTLIYVFVWYDPVPHDVFRWMFVTVPSKVVEKLLAGRAG
ncbi:MAG: hypothetical protein ACXWEX_00110 [Thermoanaerobaculia bacterium]